MIHPALAADRVISIGFTISPNAQLGLPFDDRAPVLEVHAVLHGVEAGRQGLLDQQGPPQLGVPEHG